MIPTSACEVLARLRSADPAVRRSWLRLAVRLRLRRRRVAAARIAARFR